MGKILKIDLDLKKVTQEEIDLKTEKAFIGGFGVGARLAYDLITPGLDPLDPRNPIIVSAGVFGGTPVPGSARLSVMTKYPLTGAIAMGNGGMGFSRLLRLSGYDHLIVGGKAKLPTVIKIFNDQVELLDATDLWGKDIYETTDLLRERFGQNWSIMAIGQAGEKLAHISLALIDKISSIGKGGLGAVMGAKKLKAIAVSGSSPPFIHDPARFKKTFEKVYERVKAFPARDKQIELSIYSHWDRWFLEGFPIKAFTEVFPKNKATELYGEEVYLQKVKKARTGCPSCPFPDKEVMEIREGEFKGVLTYAGLFIGRAANFGIQCGVGSYDKVLKSLDLANRFGICAQSFSSLLDFAVELFEKKRLTREDTGGIALKRDFETTTKLLNMTARREGFGNVLANGYHGMSDRFGEDLAGEALQVKGMDMHMLFDPRLTRLGTRPFILIVNPRGGHHQPGVTPSDAPGRTVEDFRAYCQRTGIPSDATERIMDGPMRVNMARLAKHSQEFYSVLSSLGICTKWPTGQLYDIEDCAELYAALHGMDMIPLDLKKAGERIWNLYKMLNVREGFDRKNDVFPKRWLTPMKGEREEKPLMDYFGTTRLAPKDLQNLLDDYYDEAGWNKEKGIPTLSKLEELGLYEAIRDLKT